MRGLFARIAWAAFQPKVVDREPGQLTLQFPRAVRLDKLDEDHLELLGEAVTLPSGIESASVTSSGKLTVSYDPARIDEEAVLSYLEDLGQVLFENYSALEELPADEARGRMQALDSKRPTAEELRRVLDGS